MRYQTSFSEEDGMTLIELLVVMVLLGVVGTTIMTMVQSTHTTARYSNEMRTVMDDGRNSLDRIRKDLRTTRLVYPDSTASRLELWVDDDQDNVEDNEELITFCVRPVGGGDCQDPGETGGKYELVKWSQAQSAMTQPPADAQVVAKTLTATSVWNYDQPAETREDSRIVTIRLLLDMKADRGPDVLELAATVRLRNVA